MIQKIKSYMLMAVMSLMVFVPALVPIGIATADCAGNNIAGQVSSGANQASGASGDNCAGTNVDTNSIGKLAKNVVNIISVVVGAVAVIMIIVGGFRYITSGGDSNRVGGAKNTLIYAIVGLIIVALAQLIVHFVLNQANTVTSGGGA